MLQNIFDNFINQLSSNWLIILAIFIFGGIRIYQSLNTKFEEYEGHKVTSVKSIDDWKLLLKQNEDKLIIADFYATWCPPCRRASPIFGKISTEVVDAIFLKVDVDVAGDIARENGVTAMPTFKFFKGGKLIDEVVGWNESSIRSIISKNTTLTSSSSSTAGITKRK